MTRIAALLRLREIRRQRSEPRSNEEQIPRSEVGLEIEAKLNESFQKYKGQEELQEEAISTLAKVLTEHFKLFEPLKDRQPDQLIEEMTHLYKLTSEYYNHSHLPVDTEILDRPTNFFRSRVERSYQEVVGELEEQIRRYFGAVPPSLKHPNLGDSKYASAKDRREQVKKTMVRLADIVEYEHPQMQARRQEEQNPRDRERE